MANSSVAQDGWNPTKTLDHDAQAALAIWALDAVNTPESRQKIASGPGSQLRAPEMDRLRGTIPQACFSELPGVELASYQAVRDQYPLSPTRDSARLIGTANQHHDVPTHAPHGLPQTENLTAWNSDGPDPHLEAFAKSNFPSASECATCHQQIYDEWAISSHANAAVSPMFHAFEETITKLSQGTVGYFCMRCHAPVATTMNADRAQPIWAGPKVFREGVTCVACHRVKNPYVKSNGERRIAPGDIHAPVYGGSDGGGTAVALKYREFFKVKSAADDQAPAQSIHRRTIQFEELNESAFCMSCHQVAVQPGIKLEVVWDQYRASPACREGVSCQDCHMGRVPGRNEGYSFGPAAVVDGKTVNPERKHSNHGFFGPGYSIAHPGIFPFEKGPDRWSFNDWQQFDWRAGWGSEGFERALASGQVSAWFPETWNNIDDRMDAREIVDRNLAKLGYKKDLRRQVMENGSRIDGPFFDDEPCTGSPLRFEYVVTNTNTGHNLPSGSLGAQPQLWRNNTCRSPGKAG